MCELRVDTYSYVGVGNSVNKKDAQTNAANDFVQYLVRQGQIDPSEIPSQQVCFLFMIITFKKNVLIKTIIDF